MKGRYNPDNTYAADAYKRENGKDILIQKDLTIYYFEDEDKWITWDNYLKYCVEPLVYRDKYNQEESKEAEIQFQKSLMPDHNIKEGDTFIDIKTLRLVMTRLSDPEIMFDKILGPSWRKKR